MRGLLKFLVVLVGVPMTLFFAGITWAMVYHFLGLFLVEVVGVLSAMAVVGVGIYAGIRLFGLIDGGRVVSMRSEEEGQVTPQGVRFIGNGQLEAAADAKAAEKASQQDEVDALLAEINRDRGDSAFDVSAFYGEAMYEEAEELSPALQKKLQARSPGFREQD